MQFLWNWWVVASLFIYVIVGGIGALFVAEAYESKAGKYAAGIISWLIGAALFNGFFWLVSSAGESVPNVGTHIVSQELGLVSGRPYSVELGTRVQGSTGSGRFYGGIFSSGGKISLQPGSSVSMGFAKGDSSYILEVPMNKVHFVKSATERGASVQLYLNNLGVGQFGSMTSTGKRCETAVYSLTLWRLCQNTFEYTIPPDVERRGLAPIVTEYLDSATITLNPELYEQLLGTP